MSNLTPNLGLFKYDVKADEKVPFSITEALNNNWDILDEKCKGSGLDNKITNCLLEIPQRIKYTLVDGDFTLKAGSVVIVPMGTEDLTGTYPIGSTFKNANFKVYDRQFSDGKFFVWAQVQSDVKLSGTAGNTVGLLRPLFLSLDSNVIWGIANSISSATQYSGTANCANYRTDLNTLQISFGGVLRSDTIAFPLVNVIDNGTYLAGSLKNIFNGMGYIGSTAWVDKGVKGLIPDGKNEDGSLKNIEFTTDRVLISNSTTSTLDVILALTPYGNSSGICFIVDASTYTTSETPPSTSMWYKPSANRFYILSNGVWKEDPQAHVAIYSVTAGVISNFQPIQPIIIADDQKVVHKSGDTMTGTLSIQQNMMAACQIKTINPLLDYTATTAPSENIYPLRILGYGKNNQWIGSFETEHRTNNLFTTRMLARRSVGGVDKVGSIEINIDASGNILTYAPALSVTNSIVTTTGISKATNGYVKFGNGIILQWGQVTWTSVRETRSTVTFPTAFSSTNYGVCICPSEDNSGGTDEACISTYSYATTSFGFYVYGRDTGEKPNGMRWVAIGY